MNLPQFVIEPEDEVTIEEFKGEEAQRSLNRALSVEAVRVHGLYGRPRVKRAVEVRIRAVRDGTTLDVLGFAFCGASDVFSKMKGVLIATGRAVKRARQQLRAANRVTA